MSQIKEISTIRINLRAIKFIHLRLGLLAIKLSILLARNRLYWFRKRPANSKREFIHR